MFKKLLVFFVFFLWSLQCQAALVTSPQLTWPDIIPQGSITSISSAVNATGTKFGYVFEAPATGTITGLSFRTGTVTTGTTTGVDVRLETVGTDGFPTGTLVGTNTNLSGVAVSTSNTWYNVTFTSGASVTRGVRYALVIVSDTASVFAVAGYSTGNGVPLYGLPWYGTYNGSAWTYASNISVMAGVLNYGGTYPYSPAFVPGVTQLSTTFNSGSTPDVRGLKFTLPYPAKVSGFQGYWDHDGPATVKLYDSDGVTVLASVDIDDADYPPTTAARQVRYTFSSDVTLAANTAYRIALEPDSGTSIGMGELALGNSAWYTATAYETFGAYTTAKDPSGTGSWTDSTSTVMPQLGLVITALDNGASTSAAPSVCFQ
jgi:hypothetical protein